MEWFEGLRKLKKVLKKKNEIKWVKWKDQCFFFKNIIKEIKIEKKK